MTCSTVRGERYLLSLPIGDLLKARLKAIVHSSRQRDAHALRGASGIISSGVGQPSPLGTENSQECHAQVELVANLEGSMRALIGYLERAVNSAVPLLGALLQTWLPNAVSVQTWGKGVWSKRRNSSNGE